MALFKNQFRKYKKKLLNGIFKAGTVLEGEMHKIVAIDTGALNESIGTREPRIEGFNLVVSVGSRGIPYAKIVNDGVGEVYNYHRRKGGSRTIVYTGDGQKWAERSLELSSGRILSILRNITS